MNNESPPLSIEAIEDYLDEVLDAVLSSRRTTAEPAVALARLSRIDQEFALSWLNIIAQTNSEMGYQFVRHISQALQQMDRFTVEKWIVHAMDEYDRFGLYPGSEVFATIDDFNRKIALRATSATLNETTIVLEHYLCGLSGRSLSIRSSDESFTDTETLWLPPLIQLYCNKQQNLSLYKAIAVHLWAQIHHGTFRRASPDAELLSERLDRYPDPNRARQLFNSLETRRLDAYIARDLPGLSREMLALVTNDTTIQLTSIWKLAIGKVEQDGSSVTDTLNQLNHVYADAGPVPTRPWQGVMLLDRVEAMASMRIQREHEELQVLLAQFLEKSTYSNPAKKIKKIQLGVTDYSENTIEWVLKIDDKPILMPETITNLLQSVLLDFSQIPANYLIADASSKLPLSNSEQEVPEAREKQANHEETGILYYDEWDFRRRHYRKNWCVLREIDMYSSPEPIVEQTLDKYAGLVSELRRTFEALRGSNRRLKRQASGDEIDLEAVVEAQTDICGGREMPERLFSQTRRIDRDTAVMFMVDVSGSTKGWINDAERESLVLLCEAVEILGDQYAIYGFSGMTRKRCELYRIKRFDDHYDNRVKARIAGIRPQDYTRMGVAIRHLTKLLARIDAHTRLLVTLSDGKPDDYDGYRGEYGIEDTRQALIEARRAGIHPFCITIDHSARDYLPHMYGEVNYTLVNEVEKLPRKVSEIYRRLTS